MDTPRFEPDESQPLGTGPDSLPPRTARRLYKAASQGQLGKAWRQLRAPPPVHVGPKQWDEAVAKLTPHENQEGSALSCLFNQFLSASCGVDLLATRSGGTQ